MARPSACNGLRQDLGVRCVEVESNSKGADGIPLYDAACAKEAMDLVFGGTFAT